MKTYVFLTRRICEIGGVEQYLYNKVKYLESQGWRVLVFSARHGEILIRELQRFEPCILPALEHCPDSFSKREVRRVLQTIRSEIGDCSGENCIVESHSAIRAVWAELIAKELGCRHLAFVLQESHKYDAEMKAFLRFKYDRHELAGINEISVQQMLGDETLEKRSDARISAFCNNSIDDCEDPYSSMLDAAADCTFGSIGRLVKPCTLPIVRAFREYICAHPDQKFNLVMIGDAPSSTRITEIRELMADCENVNLVFTGNIYPIPRSFVNQVDVFVSTAGSATVTYRAGRPSVLVHPVTGEPVGIIGLDFRLGEKKMYDSNPELSIVSCIEKALAQKGDIDFSEGVDAKYFAEMHAEYDRQLHFVDLEPKNAYYDAEKLMRIKTQPLHAYRLQRLADHVLGAEKMELIRKYRMRKEHK